MKKRFFALRAIFGTLMFASLLVICILCVNAASDNDVVSDDNEYIANFDNSADGFVTGENTVSVDKTDFYFEDGKSAACLEVKSKAIPIDSLRSVVKTFSEPTDLSAYRKISYNIFVPEYEKDADAVYYARLILQSYDGRVFESIDVVEVGKWSTVELDISSFGGRSQISSVEVAFIVDTSLQSVITDSFYIDDILAFDMADVKMVERFLFDSYTVEGGSAVLASDKSKISIFSNSTVGVTISAPLFMPVLSYDVNCLRLKLANYTDGDYLTLYYSVMDERAVSESRSIVVPIEPNSDARFYYIPIDNADQITDLSLLFGENVGRVELISLGVTFMHESQTYDTHGKVSCRINDDLASISFSGEVNRETALENQSGKIEIYKLEDEFSDLAELEGLTPIIEGAMTTKFDFTWRIPSGLKLSMLERYIAVIATVNGEYLLVSPPVCVENPEALAENFYEFPIDGKGFYTDDLSLVTDSDLDITVLELDMLSAFLERTEGTSYVYNGEIYYLNTEYIAEVEKLVDMMFSNGTSVLIRLTNRIRSDMTSPVPESVGAVTDSRDYIGAVSSYISEKWVADGRVCGVILGYGENCVGEWNNIGEMVTECAETLKKISVILLKNNADARVYLSVTDLFSRDILTNTDEVPLVEYLDVLFKSASVYGKNYFGLCVESPYRTEEIKDGTFISISDNEELKSLIEKYGALKYNSIFCDEIYKKQKKYLGLLLKNYVVGYHTAIFDDGVDGYIAVAEGKSTGLAEAVKIIDTTNSDILLKPALAMLEINSLSDIIGNFDESKLQKRLFNKGSVSYTIPEKIMGQYKLHEFNSAVAASAAMTTYYDSKCRIVNDDEMGTVLSVGINEGIDVLSPSVFGILTEFKYTENLEFMSWIGVDLKVYGDITGDGEKVPVKLVLTSENERFESEAEVTVGEWTKVYFNVDDFKNAKDTKRMQILADGKEFEVSELRIKEIIGLSEEYNNESLESVVLEERLKKRDPNGGKDYGPYMWLGGGMLITVATGVAVALLSRKKRVEK